MSEQRTLTVVFTDVEGSTELGSRWGDDAAQEALRAHEEAVRAGVERHGGRLVKALGDGFMLAFPSVRSGLACAIDLQTGLAERNRADPGKPLLVRMGVHTGEVTERDGDLFGQTVNAASRIAAQARGGQVLVAPVVRDLAGDLPGTEFVDRGLFWLKGFPEKWRLFEARPRDERKPATSTASGTLFVGRESEQADLRRMLDQAQAGRGTLALVSGEPGVGKSRLAMEIAAEAAARGMQVFTGHCTDMEGAPPYLPVVEILETAVRTVSEDTLREVLGDDAPEIARLVPEIRRRFPDTPPPLELPPEQGRRYLFNSVRDFLDRAARRRPLVLVLEDLQWADGASLQLLQHLAADLERMPVLAIGTYRDVDLDLVRPLARTLEELHRRRLVHRVALDRLPPEDVRTMLGSLSGHDPPDAVADAIFRETEGNPFFVEELYHHLADEGAVNPSAGWRDDLGAEVAVPESVRLVIGRRLERLSEPTLTVLTEAAVLGRAFEVPVLDAMSDAQPDAVVDALDEAERARLIADADGGVRFAFAHEVTRQTLLTALSSLRRQRLHLRAAEALERVYAEAVEDHAVDLAHHLVHAGVAADRDKTVRFLGVAGERALDAAAFEDAVHSLEHAMELIPADDRVRRADLLFKLGLARRGMGLWEEALPAWREAMAISEALGDAQAVGKLSTEIALQLAWAAKWEECLEVVARGLAALGEGMSADRVRLLGLGGLILSVAGNHDAAQEMIELGAALAEGMGDETLSAYIPVAEALHHYSYSELRQAVETGRRGEELLRKVGAVWDLVSLVPWVAFSLFILGRFDEAMEEVEETTPLAGRLGHLGSLLILHRVRSLHAMAVAGDLEAFERAAEEDLELCRKSGLPWESHSYVWLGLCAMWRGRHDDAVDRLREAVRLEPPGAFAGVAPGFLALALASAGSGTESFAVVEEHRHLLPVPGRPVSLGSTTLASAAMEAADLLGDADRARALYPGVEGLAEDGVVLRGWDLALVERLEGMHARTVGDLEASERHFEAALRAADELPHVVEAPQVRHRYAEMLLARGGPGDRERARELLGDAIKRYRAIGMEGPAKAAEALLD